MPPSFLRRVRQSVPFLLLAPAFVSCGGGGTVHSEPSAHALLTRRSPEQGRTEWRLPPLVAPDVESGVALALAADEVVASLGPAEQEQFWERLMGRGPQRPTDLGPGPARLRQELDVLRASLGSDTPALLALFVGHEPVARVMKRLGVRKRAPELAVLLQRLPSRRKKAAAPAEQALRLATLYGMSWPVERSYRISSRFGYRFHPVRRRAHLHRGVDVAVPIGTPIKAPAAGRVKRVRRDSRNGRWLELDHGAGVTTVFCHSSEVKVRRGQRVELGDVIALSGNTGRTTGPHLHYQLHVSDEPVDPLAVRVREGASLLQARRSSPKSAEASGTAQGPF